MKALLKYTVAIEDKNPVYLLFPLNPLVKFESITLQSQACFGSD